MKHYISTEDVELGRKESHNNCPTALSFRNQGAMCISTSKESTVFDTNEGIMLEVRHGMRLILQIYHYDNGRDFKVGYYDVYPKFMVGLDEY